MHCIDLMGNLTGVWRAASGVCSELDEWLQERLAAAVQDCMIEGHTVLLNLLAVACVHQGKAATCMQECQCRVLLASSPVF